MANVLTSFNEMVGGGEGEGGVLELVLGFDGLSSEIGLAQQNLPHL